MKTTIRNQSALRSIAAFLTLTLVVSACTQPRPEAFPDGQGEDLIEKTVFSQPVIVHTSAQALPSADNDPTRAFNEVPQVSIVSTNAAIQLVPMFRDLKIFGKTDSDYRIQFKLTEKAVIGYKIVDETEVLPLLETQIGEKSGEGSLAVPIFHYSVQNFGVVVRAKNDLKEETSTLRLQPTMWNEATHIQLSTLVRDRQLTLDRTATERLFRKEKLENALLTRSDLQRMNIAVAGEQSDVYLSRFNGSKDLNLYLVTDANSPLLSKNEKEILRKGDLSDPSVSGQVRRCDDALMKRLNDATLGHLAGKDCVVVLRTKITVSSVVAKRHPISDDGTLSGEITIEGSGKSGLVKIEKEPEVKELNPNEVATNLLPGRSLVVAKVKGKEFLFRRTLQDTPNSFDYTFAGTSGNLEIVKFNFESDRVRVVRADPLYKGTGSNSLDAETLLSIPATYVKQVLSDESGHALSNPRLVPANADDANAIAQLDWSENEIPNISSPMEYYGLEQCFASTIERLVSGVDQRLNDGMLSFSVTTTYAASPEADCAGLSRAGYFDDAVQTIFTFKERFSFKRYERKAEEKPLLAMPYTAQRLMGFGLFTYNHKNPDSYGNTDTDGTQLPLASIFNIRGGKKITYTLAGLPSDSTTREAVIRATREVVSDLNNAFRKALAGTALERKDDVIELKIEGLDIDARQLGDLDRNYIYYVQKRTNSPVIGLGGAHPNPRTGEVEAASVFIYGGNILSAVDGMKKMEKAREEYRKAIGAGGKTDASEAEVPSLPDVAGGADAPADPATPTQRTNLALDRVLRNYQEQFKAAGGSSLEDKSAVLAGIPTYKNTLAFYEAFRQGAKAGALRDPKRMELFIGEKLAQVLQGKISAQEMSRLRATLKHQKSVAATLEKLERANICVYSSADAERVAVSKPISGMTDLEGLIAIYKPTLAHEIGHNLGLRHNFIGSFDKANWKFSDSEKTPRTYSSIMDYLSDDHETYDGMGPQDVAALRAAYGGVVELADGKLIGLEEYKKALGLSSWLQLNAHAVTKIPLKQYQFCSDEDAGETPVCNRFDRGTTPAEIVNAIVEDYRTTYSLRNFANDKLRFDWWDSSAYISRLFGRLIPARQFLEETIYQAVNGAGGETVGAYAEAAVKAMTFFHEIVRTPDASSLLDDGERFASIKTKEGKSVVIERKWLENIAFGDTFSRIRVRGVEFDKVISLLLLTDRHLGFPRYEAAKLSISFPDFEKLVFEGDSPMDLPTLGLLSEVLSDEVSPAAMTAQGFMPLGGQFKAKTTEMIRVYGVLGSISSLDVDGLRSSDNLSALFRVQSAFKGKTPTGVIAITQPGTRSDSLNELRYWASPDALASFSLIQTASRLEQVSAAKDELTPLIVQWVTQAMTAGANSGATPPANPPAGPPAPVDEKIDAVLAKLPEGTGPRKMAEIGPVLLQVLETAAKLKAAQEKLPRKQLMLIVEEISTQLEHLAKVQPTMAVAMAALLEKDLKMPETVGMIVPASVVDTQRGILFSSAQTLNRIFLSLHPEFNR